MLIKYDLDSLTMVEKKPVSVNWQMVFVLIPFLDLYASYRIQKLRLWLLIFGVGFGIAAILLNYVLFGIDHFGWDNKIDAWDSSKMLFHITLTVITFGAAVYVIRRWSISWNKKLN